MKAVVYLLALAILCYLLEPISAIQAASSRRNKGGDALKSTHRRASLKPCSNEPISSFKLACVVRTRKGFWTVALPADQSLYPGKLQVTSVLQNKSLLHVGTLTEKPKEAQILFGSIVPRWFKCLKSRRAKDSLEPKHLTLSILANMFEHLHVHIMPRYDVQNQDKEEDQLKELAKLDAVFPTKWESLATRAAKTTIPKIKGLSENPYKMYVCDQPNEWLTEYSGVFADCMSKEVDPKNDEDTDHKWTRVLGKETTRYAGELRITLERKLKGDKVDNRVALTDLKKKEITSFLKEVADWFKQFNPGSKDSVFNPNLKENKDVKVWPNMIFDQDHASALLTPRYYKVTDKERTKTSYVVLGAEFPADCDIQPPRNHYDGQSLPGTCIKDKVLDWKLSGSCQPNYPNTEEKWKEAVAKLLNASV